MNRSIADVYSMENRQGTVAYDYVIGVYDFLEKLTQKYPDLLIESCSGGGGRLLLHRLYLDSILLTSHIAHSYFHDFQA